MTGIWAWTPTSWCWRHSGELLLLPPLSHLTGTIQGEKQALLGPQGPDQPGQSALRGPREVRGPQLSDAGKPEDPAQVQGGHGRGPAGAGISQLYEGVEQVQVKD